MGDLGRPEEAVLGGGRDVAEPLVGVRANAATKTRPTTLAASVAALVISAPA
jgi:hypothetical protein